MTIQETQELIEAWVAKKSSRQKNELTNIAALTEEVGELTRVVAQRYGNPAIDAEELKAQTSKELADVMWLLFAIANQTGVDMTEAIIDRLNDESCRCTEK